MISLVERGVRTITYSVGIVRKPAVGTAATARACPASTEAGPHSTGSGESASARRVGRKSSPAPGGKEDQTPVGRRAGRPVTVRQEVYSREGDDKIQY